VGTDLYWETGVHGEVGTFVITVADSDNNVVTFNLVFGDEAVQPYCPDGFGA
jgi:hypothetical protein